MEGNSVKEMGNEQVIAEKKKYTEEGVHKRMYGWICPDDCTNGYWLVRIKAHYDALEQGTAQ